MDENNKITITDELGNKKIVQGSMEGFVIRTVVGEGLTRHRPPVSIKGLDREWLGKKVLCMLIEEEKTDLKSP